MYSFPSHDDLSTEDSPQLPNPPSPNDNPLINQSSQSKPFLSQKSLNPFHPNTHILHLPETPQTLKRKFTLEPSLYIRDFVPRPKPLEIHFVPSKLRLNPKSFKDFKINQQHPILLNNNKYYISCPNSDDTESISFESDNPEEYVHLRMNNQLKQFRKTMKRSKGNVMKVFSKELICKKQFDEDEGSYLGEEELYSDEDKEDELSEEEYVLEGLGEMGVEEVFKGRKDEGEVIKNKVKKGRMKRFNSCSILDILESNLKN